MKNRLPTVVGAIAVTALFAYPVRAAGIPASASGVSVELDVSTGAYGVMSQTPAWTFGGSLNTALGRVKTTSGRDNTGAFDEVRFVVQDSLKASIRRYRDRPIAVFSWTTTKAGPPPAVAFPSFNRLPAGLGVLSYKDSNFSPRSFKPERGSTPWVLFDAQGDTAVISPAANFMVADMSGDAKTEVSSSISAKVANLPAGFTHKTILVFGQGINATMEAWGTGLTDTLRVKRPANDADLFLKYLGYWTDNGAAYYYNYDKALGYEGTLVAVRNEIEKLGIPIRYFQLDSWWYQKTTVNYKGEDEKAPKVAALPAGTWNAYGGLTKYEAHPFVFPDGLDGFQKKVHLPLATHNRWIDVNSPYRAKYDVPGLQSTDPAYWDEIIGYIARSGVKMYEQDWLNYTWEYSPKFQTEPFTATRFLDAMAGACAKYGLSMQYCMTLPRYLMQGAKYPNLTNVRVSDDRFERRNWEASFYTSRLASSLGEWPWVDTFMSRERENMLLATLSAGLVGFGDFMGRESVENALMAARPDGILVKPDVCITPTDATILSDSRGEHRPLVATTYTQHGGRRTAYVFAYPRRVDSTDASFRPGDLGIDSGYAYKPFTGESRVIKPGETISETLASNGSSFTVLAPTGVSGIAFLGDKGKFVGTGKQRIASINEEPGSLTARVLFAPGETSVTLHGFSATHPKSPAAPVLWNEKNGYFTLVVPSSGKRDLTVTITTR